MLGDLAYHRGVAYSMAAGMVQGEGPYAGLISYYGGLFPLVFGWAADAIGTSFDRVVSVASWLGGPLWVLASLVMAIRLWPGDRSTISIFVLLATVAAPFSQRADQLWVESTLAGSSAYWPLYPRDVALVLVLLLVAVMLASRRWLRVGGAGLIVATMAMFHVQIAIVAGGFLALHAAWEARRTRDRFPLMEVGVAGIVALVAAAWWWLPRVEPTLASGGLLLSDYVGREPLRLDLQGYLVMMGPVGIFSLIGLPVMLTRRPIPRATGLILVLAAALIPLILLDRLTDGLDLLSERRLWLLFSIPATVAAAVAVAGLVRILPKLAVVVVGIAMIASLIPGTRATLAIIGTAWTQGEAGGTTWRPSVWVPLWNEVAERTRERRGLLLGTYDTYATWTWSFTGASVVSAWLPGPFKLGFDPARVTGLGYLERLAIIDRSFRGRDALCSTLEPLGVDLFLLDRRDDLVAAYDHTPASRFRLDPRARATAEPLRLVAPGIEYQDLNGYDRLQMEPGASIRLDWTDPGIEELVIEVEASGGGSADLVVSAGGQTTDIGGNPGRRRYVVRTPDGVQGDLTISARSRVWLYRVSGFVSIAGLEGRDGPFIVEGSVLCR